MTVIDLQTISAVLPSAVTTTPTRASLTLDETWAPYAQGSITIPTPASLTGLNPQSSSPPRVQLSMTQVWGEPLTVAALSTAYGAGTVAALSTAYGAGTVAAISTTYGKPFGPIADAKLGQARTADLGIRSRTVNPLEGTVTLVLESDEALLQDYAPVPSSLGYPRAADYDTTERIYLGPTQLRDLVNWVLSFAIPGSTLSTSFGDTVDSDLASLSVTYPGIGSGVPWPAGMSGWDFLAPYVQAAGARLWCSSTRVWRLSVDPVNYATRIAVAATKTLKDLSDTISRQDDSEWYDAVVIHYEWTSSGVVLSDDDSAFASASAYSKVFLQTYTNTPAPPAGAAAAVLRRKQAQARSVPLTAVAELNANPGAALTITEPDATVLTGHIAAVTWTFESADMSLTARDLA